MPKIKVGFFSFTGCEGCMMVFLELLNTKYSGWNDCIDIINCRLLKSENVLSGMDVAFVEGAISTPSEEHKLKKIRTNAKRLVAIGSCAVTGGPANQRNFFDEERKREIDFLVKKFNQREKISAVGEIVRVDEEVIGCPMLEDKFVEILEKSIKEMK